jgi:hypothetical protein
VVVSASQCGHAGLFNRDVILQTPPAVGKSLNPEKLKILTQQELDAMPSKAGGAVVPIAATPVTAAVAAPVVAPAGPTSCYEWGNFTSSNLPSAQVVLVKLGLQSSIKHVVSDQADRRFWVYYPPLKNAELAQEKANEIRALGVDDLFIVQDSQWRNAISFGLFQDEELAANLLTDLQSKGVKGAAKTLRNPGKTLSSLQIKGVSAQAAQDLQRIKPEFVGTELVQAACVL